MEYRPIGKTGLQASVIGLGSERIDGKSAVVVDEVVGTAIDQGVNIMDVFVPGEEVRRNIGKALKGRRDKMLLQGHIGSTDVNEQYDISRDLNTCKQYFETLLECLGTDYIDFGMLFYMDTDKEVEQVLNGPVYEYARELKQKGVIRHIGASSHKPLVARRLVEAGAIDLLMFSVNPVFDMAEADTSVLDYLRKDVNYIKDIDPNRAALYQLCAQKGVAITVMKTYLAGKLLDAKLSPLGAAMSTGQCINYALSRPGVVSVMLGCSEKQHVLDGVHYLLLSDEEKDYSQVLQGKQGALKGNCVYCNHCRPCPAEINIAAVNQALDVAKLDTAHVPAATRAGYQALKAHASDCIECGSCEERCPFDVPVCERMKEAAGLFGI
jgi:predicted aldo/keto reductase-like oxidoreductase